jgi:hypothetical protein
MIAVSPAGQDASAAFLEAPPPFFSAAYHFRFLPQVIAYRLDQYRQRSREQGFRPHAQLELPLLVFACLLLVLFGLPPALQSGSIVGWLSALLGAGGFAALLGWAITGEARWRREEGHRYGYAEFMPSVFFFCVLAGGSAGLIGGGVGADSALAGYLLALPGLVAGYLAGPFAARWVHALGFMKTWFIYLALLGLVLLPLEDLLVVFIYSSKASDSL